MKEIVVLAVALIASVPTLAQQYERIPDEDVFTLYRSSFGENTMRIHVATFDTNSGSAYNEENCSIARDLFRNQPGVSVAYWCERGYVKDAD